MPTQIKLNVFRALLITQGIEISFLGSGRLLQFGPFTLRMYLFIAAILLSFSFISKVHREVLLIMGLIVFSFCMSLLVGLLRGNSLSLIFDDISPLLFLLGLPFVHYTVNRHPETMRMLASVFEKSSLVIAIMFAFIVAFILAGFISFRSFYLWAFSTGEFFFRPLGNGSFGVGFFYKGFIYLGLGFFFYFFSQNKPKNSVIAAFLALALALTLTRGLVLCLFLTLIVYYLFERRKKSLFIITIMVGLAYFSVDTYMSFLGNKEASDSVRIDDMVYILNNTSLLTLITGNGFGSLINNRVSVENSFLEIAYIQGLIGLTPYMIIFYKSYSYYFRIDKENRLKFSPFFYGIIFVSLLSFTNPVINNPLGIFFMIVGFSVLSNSRIISNK